MSPQLATVAEGFLFAVLARYGHNHPPPPPPPPPPGPPLEDSFKPEVTVLYDSARIAAQAVSFPNTQSIDSRKGLREEPLS